MKTKKHVTAFALVVCALLLGGCGKSEEKVDCSKMEGVCSGKCGPRPVGCIAYDKDQKGEQSGQKDEPSDEKVNCRTEVGICSGKCGPRPVGLCDPKTNKPRENLREWNAEKDVKRLYPVGKY